MRKVTQDTCDIVKSLTSSKMTVRRIAKAINIGKSTVDRIKISNYNVDDYIKLGRKYHNTKKLKKESTNGVNIGHPTKETISITNTETDPIHFDVYGNVAVTDEELERGWPARKEDAMKYITSSIERLRKAHLLLKGARMR